MKRILLAGLCAGALCLCLMPGLAVAQDDSVTSREGIALQNQILSVQSQMQQMQAQLQAVQAKWRRQRRARVVGRRRAAMATSSPSFSSG